VERWAAFVVSGRKKLADIEEVRELVRSREQGLKSTKSRFLNRRALDQWGGAAALRRLSFRWPITSRLLNDLLVGLKAEKGRAHA
jgi:hypothetical protein